MSEQEKTLGQVNAEAVCADLSNEEQYVSLCSLLGKVDFERGAQAVIADYVARNPPVELLNEDEERMLLHVANKSRDPDAIGLLKVLRKRFPRPKRWEPCTPGQALDHRGEARWQWADAVRKDEWFSVDRGNFDWGAAIKRVVFEREVDA